MAERFEPKEETIDVDDYRAYFESDILRVWHLNGKERVYRIVRVTRLTSEMFTNGKKQITRQPKLELATRHGEILSLPFLLNKVNSKTIAQMYGKRPSGWVDKWIQLYPTTTENKGEIVDCIRVRNQPPGADRPRKQNKQGTNVLPPASEPAPLDHDRSRRNDEDGDALDAEYEVVQ
jgi:hypothetical protein